MESCRPAIIVSFGVTAHWLPQKGDREAGIDSVAEFRGLTQHGHPRFETPRSAPVAQAFLPVFFGGWAMAISVVSDIPACSRSVSKWVLNTFWVCFAPPVIYRYV